ncbi:MAG: NAD-dependent epimerase/dehydratase family protein [Opitutales bacterium]
MGAARETAGSNRRLVITGCGYVGRAVAETALAAGWAVEALTRNGDKAAQLRSTLGLRVVEGDLASDDWHEALDPAGATVINCVSSGGGGVEGYRRSYLDGMRSLLEWAARGPVRALLYTSSTSLYGDAGGDWVDESTAASVRSPFNEVLLATEQALEAAASAGIVPAAAALRLAGIYGPGRHYFLDTMRGDDGPIPGYGDYVLNLIHRDDAARALLAVAAQPPRGYELYNVADDAPALREEIAAWTAEQLGRPTPPFDPARMSERQRRRALSSGRPPNRRIANRKLKAAHSWAPQYADFRAGYRALLAGAGEGGRNP